MLEPIKTRTDEYPVENSNQYLQEISLDVDEVEPSFPGKTLPQIGVLDVDQIEPSFPSKTSTQIGEE